MSLSPLNRPPSLLPTSVSHSRRLDDSNDDVELQLLTTAESDSDDSNTSEPATSSSHMARTRRAAKKSSNDSFADSNMNSSSSVEFRRKVGVSHDFDLGDSHISPASQTAALLEREAFSLDETVDPNKAPSSSFMELSQKDQRNFLLLVLLYFLQGVPMGLAMGSVPFLLKDKLSYGEIGVFSLASYPYSMKLLWSPIVDAIWSPKFGRRKSWIVPIQTISAFALIWLGSHAAQLMEDASTQLYFFTFVFFSLVMLCATQDIAVDGELHEVHAHDI